MISYLQNLCSSFTFAFGRGGEKLQPGGLPPPFPLWVRQYPAQYEVSGQFSPQQLHLRGKYTVSTEQKPSGLQNRLGSSVK